MLGEWIIIPFFNIKVAELGIEIIKHHILFANIMISEKNTIRT